MICNAPGPGNNAGQRHLILICAASILTITTQFQLVVVELDDKDASRSSCRLSSNMRVKYPTPAAAVGLLLTKKAAAKTSFPDAEKREREKINE